MPPLPLPLSNSPFPSLPLHNFSFAYLSVRRRSSVHRSFLVVSFVRTSTKSYLLSDVIADLFQENPSVVSHTCNSPTSVYTITG